MGGEGHYCVASRDGLHAKPQDSKAGVLAACDQGASVRLSKGSTGHSLVPQVTHTHKAQRD